MTDERVEYFEKGYRKGLEEAWKEVLSDAKAASTLAELRMILRAKAGTIDRRVEAQVSLLKRELGISEESASSSPDELIEGSSYLVKEKRPKIGYALFNYLIRNGHTGLCISRSNQEVIRRKYGVRDFTHIRLGSHEKDGAMLSSALGIGESVSAGANLTRLFDQIRSFLDSNPGSVVLMDGAIEYLINENDFNKVLRFIQRLNDRIEESRSYMFIIISPDALKKQDMAKLERETVDTFSEDEL